jgi:cytidyltransferase-like protein
MRIILVSGGFDPIHSGHIEYFKSARELGDKLIVGLNSDAWLTKKKGRAFMPIWERDAVIRELKMVDMTMMVTEDPDGSCTTFIRETLDLFPNDEIVFANGGDRTATNIPEMQVIDPRVSFVFGVGGENKKNSSRWILEEWKTPKTERSWGYYRVLHEQGNEVKVKELTVEPGKCLSMQRHADRAEHWFVSEGTATVLTIDEASTDSELDGVYNKFDNTHIYRTKWHQLCNDTTASLKIIEIQYGENCIEEDIERKN